MLIDLAISIQGKSHAGFCHVDEGLGTKVELPGQGVEIQEAMAVQTCGSSFLWSSLLMHMVFLTVLHSLTTYTLLEGTTLKL
jgi:hypothetical protein